MRFSSVVAIAVAGRAASASPIETRATALTSNDVAVLQLAHFLEILEYNLYEGGLHNFTDAQYNAAGFPPGFINSVGQIASQEATHRDFLAAVLTANGETPAPACQYSFPYTTPKTFVSLANMITSTGIGAYIGGADLVMNNPTILTAAASILSTEARHDSILRAGAGANPAPSSFDTPVTAIWAYSIASQFTRNCPAAAQLFPKPYPTLTLTAPAADPDLRPGIAAGDQLTFTWNPKKFMPRIPGNTKVFVFFINQVGAPSYVPAGTASAGKATVALPAGLAGVTFAGLTSSSGGLNVTMLSKRGTLAGPTVVALS